MNKKIPEDLNKIYIEKKKNINFLKFNEYNYLEKINYLDSLSASLKKGFSNDVDIWASNMDVDYGNSFFITYKNDNNKFYLPSFNFICSLSFKYFYINNFDSINTSTLEKNLKDYIKEYLNKIGYKELYSENLNIETDIKGVEHMPYEDFLKKNNLAEYQGKYKMYHVVFGEEW